MLAGDLSGDVMMPETAEMTAHLPSLQQRQLCWAALALQTLPDCNGQDVAVVHGCVLRTREFDRLATYQHLRDC